MKTNQTTNSIKTMTQLFALAIIIGGFALNAFAAPPTNDNFANPVGLTGSGSNSGTNAQATREAGEPAHALNRGAQSVWYKYIATESGVLTINTTGSSFDTLLAVYSGSSVSNLKLFAANDDIDSVTLQSQVVVGIQAGSVYYIAVDGFRNAAGTIASGSVILNYTVSSVVPNDNFANAVQLPGEKGQVTTTNVGASKEPGEPNHANNGGGKSVWFKWTAPAGSSKSYAFSVGSLNTTAINGVNTLMAIYTGSSVNSLVNVAQRYVNGTNDPTTGKLILKPTPGATYYIALDGFTIFATEVGTFTLSYDITKSDKVPDFDRDGKADISVYRPTTGAWYSLESVTDNLRAFQWGANGDKPLFSEFDNNGIPSYSIFRPSVGAWYIKDQPNSNSYQSFQWGANTDIPLLLKEHTVNGNSNGDTFDTYATVFRPQTGTWYINSGGNGGNGISIPFGQLGDIPAAADFDGDGTDELAVFRPTNGTWYILNRKTNQYQVVQFGQSGDVPVAADYDADGKIDVAVYRPSTGAWYALRSSDGQFQTVNFGISTDLPQPADYDGDGKADYAVFRPSNGTWYIQQSSNGFKTVPFGANNDVPVTAPNPLP